MAGGIIPAVFRFQPFSRKQKQILTWWLPESGVSDYDGIIADGAIRSGKTVCMSLSFVIWSMETFQRLASYVTKEVRAGTKGNGARAYTPSTNLDQPVIDGHWCSEFEGLALPVGAEKISSGADCNEIYGSSMEYLFYRMPRDMQQPQPYKSKGKVYSKKTRPESQ